ncbi:MAG: hypothetical protein KJ065_19670 [Anaerolineae bacterium]|nr:hypothetical protein [Anaerolineae bacterium]
MAPIVNGLEAEMGDRIEFRSLNALDGADGQQLFEALALPGHPGYVIFDMNGRETFRAFGVITVDTLRAAIEATLQEEGNHG